MEIVSYNSYAGFAKRFMAFIIDRICIWLILTLIFGYYYQIHLYRISNLFNRNTVYIELLLMTYFVLCESSRWQATLGKKLFGMKVVTEQYQKLTVKDALVRYLSKYLSTFVLLLGYIWIIFDSRKQGWHDKIAGTFVINS
jgi:uncharacterized RDD family membrane protein YckC